MLSFPFHIFKMIVLQIVLSCLLIVSAIAEEWHEIPTSQLTVEVVQDPEIKEKLFTEADTDGNGVLFYEELEEFLIGIVTDP